MFRSALLIAAIGACACAQGAEWRVSGHDLANSRSQPAEVRIGPANVHSLAPKWVFTTGGNVSATPTVFGDAIFFPDSAGNLYAINKNTGQLIWSHQISDYDGSSGAISRTSPAMHGKDIIVGDQEANFLSDNGTSINAVYACCTFRGSVVALDANTGKVLWKTYTIPDNGGQAGGYSGGPVWQPPAIDPVRHLLYVGTGNNYSVPESVLECEKQAIANNNPNANCAAPDDHFDTALALDLNDGHIRWSKRLLGYDVWTNACIFP